MSNILLRHKGRTIRNVERHQDIPVDGVFHDGQTDREFDVCKLPMRYLADDRAAVLAGDLDAQKRAIARAIDDDYDFRAPPYEPGWANYERVGKESGVAEAMDRYYKHDRLNRDEGSRDRLVKDREIDLELGGFACIACHHDAVGGRTVYVRRAAKGVTVHIDKTP
ncbi:hypothetical protein [Paraburkholderia youngii]|uniref:hypothetical protein n=1 Tax=Paraburkholderia youngii TaxID=2782701 RepID=UPI003D19C226